MSIEKRIRQTVKKKIYVAFTKRTRSKTGFFVTWPHGRESVPNKKQALQLLLAKVRCMDGLIFSITVRHNRQQSHTPKQ